MKSIYKSINSFKHYRNLISKRFSSKLVRGEFIDNTSIYSITLDSPQNRNALSTELISQFESETYTLRQYIKEDFKARALIIRSAHEKVFCAGADLKERSSMNETQIKSFVARLRSAFQSIWELDIPTIALVQGFAFGGGLELALACDFRIATSNSVIGLTETSLGIIPGAGGTARLPYLIGTMKAKELILTADRLNAQDAMNLGLLYSIHNTKEESNEASLHLAKKLTDRAPLALMAAKRAINSSIDLKRSLDLESSHYDLTLYSTDRLEGIKAFIEKRPPSYKGK